jgi:hypothetical protein
MSVSRLCLANTPSAALEPRIGGPPIAIPQVRLHLPAMLLLLKLIVWAVAPWRSLDGPSSSRISPCDTNSPPLLTVGRRARLGPADRLFWVALRAVWSDWAKSLAIVKPATVVGWHRRAYRAYWRRISRPPRRPRTDAQLRDLIRRMVTENRWGAPRIHGELLKLGFRVSERTVSRYVRRLQPRRPPGASWKTFLDNHRGGARGDGLLHRSCSWIGTRSSRPRSLGCSGTWR